MNKRFLLIFITLFSLSANAGKNQFVGTWKLISIMQESSLGKKYDSYGKKPAGYISYATDGRMITIIVKDGRRKPIGKRVTASEAMALLNSMTSYAGTYTIKGDQIIHHVDISWNQSWTGTDQTRFYKFEGKHLILTMPPFIDPIEGKTTIVLKWKKVE